MRTSENGFTLLELLIVATLIVIIVAIAIPGLMRARLSGDEASALSSIRAVLSAQSTFAASCGSGYFAPSLVRLATPPTAGGGDGFVGTDLSTDPAGKSGYIVYLTPGTADVASPASCNGAATGTLPSTYFVNADPVSMGSRYFGANQGGTIYQGSTSVTVTMSGAPPGATPVQ